MLMILMLMTMTSKMKKQNEKNKYIIDYVSLRPSDFIWRQGCFFTYSHNYEKQTLDLVWGRRSTPKQDWDSTVVFIASLCSPPSQCMCSSQQHKRRKNACQCQMTPRGPVGRKERTRKTKNHNRQQKERKRDITRRLNEGREKRKQTPPLQQQWNSSTTASLRRRERKGKNNNRKKEKAH